MKTEIEGQFCNERMRFGECGIGSVRIDDDSLSVAKKLGCHESICTIKGNYEVGDLEEGMTYRFWGVFRKYSNKRYGTEEMQFHFARFVPVTPHGKEGVIAYLAAIGKGLGLGAGTAAKAWKEWGSEAVRVIRENPRELLVVNNRIKDEQIHAIGQKLREQQATEAATIGLTELLHGRGFPKTLARKCIKLWGVEAVQIIRKDPYRLMQFRGCGFKTCDSLYLQLGLDPARLRRQALCGWYAIASEASGDTWYPIEKVVNAIRSSIGAKADPERAVELATRLGKLAPDHYGALAVIATNGIKGPLSEFGDRRWVAEGKKAAQERKLANLVQQVLDEDKPQYILQYETFEREVLRVVDHVRCHRCSRQLTAPEVHVWNNRPFGPSCIQTISDGEGVEVFPLADWMNSHPEVAMILETRPSRLQKLPAYSLWPEVDDLEIDSHQKEQLSKALIGRLGILGGSPGTGKTYTVAQLVKGLLRSGRVAPEDIAIGAPTGKAAVRITENLNAAGISMRARTWHSLLGVGERDEENDQFGFMHNERNPWSFKVLIGDEESMKDVSLMCAVFSARPRGCHVLLVGDINQLPPVGNGAPLRDLIAANVPYGELTEIKRNSGGIVETCAAIRDGQPWESGGNLGVIDTARTPAKQLEMLDSLLARCAERKLDPVWDAQVLCAVNLRSDLSRKMVNKKLQDQLNPNPKIAGCPFRLHDKIVCLKNGYYSLTNPDFAGGLDESLVDSDGRIAVANGELAKILVIEPKKIIAELYNPSREIIIPRGATSDDGSDDEESSSNGCDFDLAYALSCHKSQGSEWPVVFILIDEYPGARQICDRSWIYTAISRAKSHCFLIGRKSTADAMCRRNNICKRKTFLRELIELNHAEKMLELI